MLMGWPWCARWRGGNQLDQVEAIRFSTRITCTGLSPTAAQSAASSLGQAADGLIGRSEGSLFPSQIVVLAEPIGEVTGKVSPFLWIANRPAENSLC
jgi:hypothetical protein